MNKSSDALQKNQFSIINLKMKKMKNFLLLIVLGIGMVQFVNAQVIEVIGKGVLNVDNETLYFTDLSSIDHVVVEAAAIFWPNSLIPGQVEFYETGDGAEDAIVDFIYAEQNFSPLSNPGSGHWGYYTATFNNVDAGGISLAQMSNLGEVISFTAYVYRNGASPEMWSTRMDDHAFVYLNGSGDPLTYNFTVPASAGYRDIEVVVPFSDLASQRPRWANVAVTAGAESVSSEFKTNNRGELLRLESLVLNAVPGNVTNVTVKIYSPIEALDGKVGDSFITSSVLLTTTDLGCTLTQGYWKTHSIYGPASKPNDTWDLILPDGPDTYFFFSGQTYIEVLNTPPKKGNAYYILAHQYIAAELNFLDGAGIPSAVQEAFDEATILFDNEDNTPRNIGKLKGNDPLRMDFIRLGGILEGYNSGPGHCDDTEKSARISLEDDVVNISEFTVYPNPVRNIATIAFKPAFDGLATVDLYNSLGQKASRLLNQNVYKDIPVSFTFDGRQFTEGLYILLIQNGSVRESTKIQISR